VHRRCQAIGIRHLREHRTQCGALLTGQALRESTILFARNAAQARHDVASVIGEVQGVEPPVGFVALARNEAPSFQVVDEGDDPAG
jgi:hypothetical protein